MKKAELKKYISKWIKEHYLSKDARIVDVFINEDVYSAIVTTISCGTIINQYEVWYDDEDDYKLELVGGYHITRRHYFNREDS